MPTFSSTERLSAFSKAAFLERYAKPARPVVLENLTRAWPARERWSLDYLKTAAGNRRVPLYSSGPPRSGKHQHEPATYMALDDYLDRLSAGEKDLRIFFLNILSEIPELTADFTFPDVGLRLFRRLAVLFVAGKGARVQMHFDVDLADTLLCHFGGRKRVMLFAPDQRRYLYRVPFSFSAPIDLRPDEPDYAKYPALELARGEIAELRHGDTLYIPRGYWHYVIYDDIGFSLSLRTPPRTAKQWSALFYNAAVLRTVEAAMRRIVGRRWSDRNERRAVERTHQQLGLGA